MNIRAQVWIIMTKLDSLKERCIIDFNKKLKADKGKKQPMDELQTSNLMSMNFDPEETKSKYTIEELQAYPYQEEIGYDTDGAPLKV